MSADVRRKSMILPTNVKYHDQEQMRWIAPSRRDFYSGPSRWDTAIHQDASYCPHTPAKAGV